MNVLHTISSMNPLTGGTCQVIRNTIPELEKSGVYNEVVCLDDPSSAFIANDSFPVHALGAGKGPWQYNSALIPWLKTNAERFDVLIVHGLWLFTSYAVWKVIKRHKKHGDRKAPVMFIMPHGMLDPYFQRAGQRKLKAIRNWVYWKLIERNVVNDADGLLFTSDPELRLAREPFPGYQPKQEINVGYGIQPPPSYTPAMKTAFLAHCPTLADSPYLLFLSRIHYKKGVDLLIKAYTSLLEKRIVPAIELPVLVIAGPGLETVYGQQMQQLVVETPLLRNQVFFPGMLTGDAKWGAMYGCEAFVLPSHQENFGIAVVEALACGKPVLISNQVNIWREIKEHASGLVAEDSLEEIKKLLEKWLSLTTNQQIKMKHNAQHLFAKAFHIHQFSVRLIKSIIR